jgi:probable DNA metabolism protein
MQSVLYDGSWEGFMCAVFDVYEYKFTDADICPQQRFNGHLFGDVHQARMEKRNGERVWKGLQRILSRDACEALFRTFLSGLDDMEAHMLQYIRYAFAAGGAMETDFGNAAVLYVVQTARKVWREKHRMEAFVRFQKTTDELYYALIEPDYNVLPIIEQHFQERYADQRWLIYDARRKYGIYYDGKTVQQVKIAFNDAAQSGHDIAHAYEQAEPMYQALWQQYFKSVNIAARKNTKLHLQHMPRRYWKNMTEKKVKPQG